MSSLLNEHLLTISAAARRLGKHRDTVRSWIRRGLLESVELPCGTHTSVEAIERMAETLRARRQAEWRRADSLPSSPKAQAAMSRRHQEAVKQLKRLGIAR